MRRGAGRAALVGVLAVLGLMLSACAPAGGVLGGGPTTVLPDNPGLGDSDGDSDGASDGDSADGNGSNAVGITINATFLWVAEARVTRVPLRGGSCRYQRFDTDVTRDARGAVAGTIEIGLEDPCHGVLSFVADVREADGTGYTWVVVLHVEPSTVTIQCASALQSGGCDLVTAADQGPSGGVAHHYDITVSLSP